jgi:lysophospholipase L1-like esterase
MWYFTVLILIAVVLFLVSIAAFKRKPGPFKSILIIIVCAFSLLLALEIVFYFIPKTNSYGKDNLATDVWVRHYWKLNAEGFRDEDFSKKNTEKKKIAFIGDSYTVGWGINNPDDRFSNLVGAAVKDSFEFYNLGLRGVFSEAKSALLVSLNFKPDIVIYQYFVTDIAETRARLDSNAIMTKEPYDSYPEAVGFFLRNSYLINYLYWMFHRIPFTEYVAYINDSYNNPAIAAEHQKIISKTIAYAKANNIRLVFLTIPFTSLFDFSNKNTQAIEQLAKDSSLISINVTAGLDTLPINEITVNDNDLHLNERGNKIVADEILEQIFGIKK